MDGYLTKPLKRTDLNQTLEKLFSAGTSTNQIATSKP
jgi:hypothetical protein